ncbi:MAG: hypothetical protein AAGA97_05970 [Pseudomonadota bacterium]
MTNNSFGRMAHAKSYLEMWETHGFDVFTSRFHEDTAYIEIAMHDTFNRLDEIFGFLKILFCRSSDGVRAQLGLTVESPGRLAIHRLVTRTIEGQPNVVLGASLQYLQDSKITRNADFRNRRWLWPT